MVVMIVYAVVVVILEAIAVLIGLQLDKWLPALALPVALSLFFGAIAASWFISVYITERWLTKSARPA